MSTTEAPTRQLDFIREIVEEDLRTGRHSTVITRFPPEPNGYLHIGHAKSICLNFGVAREFGGTCNLRFDDTNPTKEDVEYVESIEEDVRWLGFEWAGLHFASDYFEQLYEYAVHLIRAGKAYVDSQSADEIRRNRGTLTEPGIDSPYRDRSVDENVDLFARMRASGERVVIDGPCLSACTLVLSLVPSSRICVTRRAVLGFHAARSIDRRGRLYAEPEASEVVLEAYPTPVRDWIRRHGGLTSRLLLLRGRELASIYPSCR